MMKFEKMENGTLRCTLTQEDLEQNGIELDDFFSNTKNARDFLEKLIRMAEDEVGFHASGNMMSIQAAIMPDDEIVLTFSESQVSGSEIIEHLKNMFHAADAEEMKQDLQDARDDILKEVGEKKKQKESVAEKPAEYVYLLTFVSFSSVREFCRILPVGEKAISRLYYLDKKKQYFLWADLSLSTRKYVYEFVAASMEYADSIEKDSIRSSYLEEHAKIILREHALETLAQL